MAKPTKRVAIQLSDAEIDALHSALGAAVGDYAASGDHFEDHFKGLDADALQQKLLRARARVRAK